MSVHYSTGSATQASCGRMAVVLTGDPREVDCYPCKETPAWREDAESVEYADSLPEGSESGADVIAFMRNVLATRQMGKWEGVLIDIQTANVVTTVYDALNEGSRAKLLGYGMPKMALVAWKVVSKSG